MQTQIKKLNPKIEKKKENAKSRNRNAKIVATLGPATSSPENICALFEAGVDIIALEMCERVELSEAVAEAVSAVNLPLWVGVSANRSNDMSPLSAFSYVDRDFETLVRELSKVPALPCKNKIVL